MHLYPLKIKRYMHLNINMSDKKKNLKQILKQQEIYISYLSR